MRDLEIVAEARSEGVQIEPRGMMAGRAAMRPHLAFVLDQIADGVEGHPGRLPAAQRLHQMHDSPPCADDEKGDQKLTEAGHQFPILKIRTALRFNEPENKVVGQFENGLYA